MATTVGQLIEQLKTLDPDTTVVFQYLVPEHTDFSIDEFESRAEALDYTDFADEMSIKMNEWLEEMAQPHDTKDSPAKVAGVFFLPKGRKCVSTF